MIIYNTPILKYLMDQLLRLTLRTTHNGGTVYCVGAYDLIILDLITMSRKKMKIQKRDYQVKIINDIITIYNKFPEDQRAVLKMPTGTGKTFTALLIAIEKLKGDTPKKCVWISHQTALSTQSCEDFFNFTGHSITELERRDKRKTYNNVTFEFYTWQSYRDKVKDADMLILDEVHCGSSKGMSIHKSFRKVLDKKSIPIHLYVSATPFDLDGSLYEGIYVEGLNVGHFKPERVAGISTQQANTLKLLCDVELRKFTSVDTVELRKLENEETKREQRDSTEEIAEVVRDHKVDLTHDASKRALKNSILHTLIEAYYKIEVVNGVVPPTIVFCTSIKSKNDPLSCKNVMKVFNEKAVSLGIPIGQHLIYSTHSQAEEESSEVLNRFKAGKIRVLCVIGQAREGFNYPDLGVAIDFAPAKTNKRLAIQKIGRIIRAVEGKPTARYYYTDSLSDYLRVNGAVKELDRDSLTKTLSGGDVEEIARGLEDVFSLRQEDEEGVPEDLDTSYNGLVEVELERSPMESEGVPKKVTFQKFGYIISDASTANVRHQAKSYMDMMRTLNGSPDTAAKKKLIWKESERLGRRLPISHDLYDSMQSYTSSSGKCYDPIFTLDYNKKYTPKVNDSKYKKDILMKKGRRVVKRDKEYRWLGSYSGKASASYDPIFILEYNKKYPQKITSIEKSGRVKLVKKECQKLERRLKPGDRYFNQQSYFISTGADIEFINWINTNYPPKPPEKRRNKKIKCNEKGKIYDSLTSAAKDLNTHSSCIILHLKGKRKHVKGYTFSYVEEE